MDIINITYYDPRHSLFKAGKSDREFVRLFYCDNYKNCKAYQNKTCLLLNGVYGHNCPYGKIQKETGYTKASYKCGDLITKYVSQYKQKCYALKEIKHIEQLNDYIFLNLPEWFDCNHSYGYMTKTKDGYINKSEDELNYHKSMQDYFKNVIINKNCVHIDNFNEELIYRILDFRPKSFFGDTINAYENECIPQFCYELKKYFPDLFHSVAKHRSDIIDYANKVTFIGKQAKLLTLNPGKVKVNTMIFNWDGKVIETTANQAHMWGNLKDAKVVITPTENSIVEIYDNDTVNENTIFI